MIIFRLLPTRVLSKQARKPSGIIGRYFMTRFFNMGNADLNIFVKELLEVRKDDTLLEIGFGPGTLIKEISQITTEGTVHGIDFSSTMLKTAIKVNKNEIAKNRVRLQQGDCSNLPYKEETFNKLCAVNTIYFWNEPSKCLSNMYRAMKPQGKIVIGFRDDKQMNNLALDKKVFTTYSQEEVLNLLTKAGFSNARIEKKEGKPFISYCAVAIKD